MTRPYPAVAISRRAAPMAAMCPVTATGRITRRGSGLRVRRAPRRRRGRRHRRGAAVRHAKAPRDFHPTVAEGGDVELGAAPLHRTQEPAHRREGLGHGVRRIDGSAVARIVVGPAAQPVFATATKGDRKPVFLVRINSSTRELHGQEALDYQPKRWPS